MKKSLLLLVILFFAPAANSAQKQIENETRSSSYESVSVNTQITLSDLESAIYSIQAKRTHKSYTVPIKKSNQLLTREFVIYYILQKKGIYIDSKDLSMLHMSPGEYHLSLLSSDVFNDLHNDSLFTPYILFAYASGMIPNNRSAYFYPKEIVNYDEMLRLVKSAFLVNTKQIDSLYSTVTHIRGDSVLSLEQINELFGQNMIPLESIYEKVKNIEIFEGEFLYYSSSNESRIYAHKINKTLYFPNLDALGEYSLYFDYEGIPFLSKGEKKYSLKEISTKLINKINTYRISHGVGVLQKNSLLQSSAQRYAETMYTSRHFEHTDQGGMRVGDRMLESGYDYAHALENLGRRQMSIERIFQDWKKSPEHNKNLLNPNVDDIGVGFYGNYWVQVSGREF